MNQFTSPPPMYRLSKQKINMDWPLFFLIMLMTSLGLAVLYSASNGSTSMLLRQIARLMLAILIMFIFAFIPPHKYKQWTPMIYTAGLSLLIAVMIMGKIGKGAQRWLDLGFFRFQPSEIMKLAVPMMTAWYLDQKPLPIHFNALIVSSLIISVPALLIVKQPDLGTGIMVAMAGLFVIFLAGIRLRLIAFLVLGFAFLAPLLWQFMHDYQKQRIIILLNPERDPLGSGYHIIQSKIAIGSGGTFGKGWLLGSQSHLNFLPEHATDFIFAVIGEEFGFVGSVLLILLIMLIALRSLHIARGAQNIYSRLLAASLSMSFFFSAFVNMGMVMGILPVVGIPLPLISYGGTAMVTFMASFGILISIASHRILFNTLPD